MRCTSRRSRKVIRRTVSENSIMDALETQSRNLYTWKRATGHMRDTISRQTERHRQDTTDADAERDTRDADTITSATTRVDASATWSWDRAERGRVVVGIRVRQEVGVWRRCARVDLTPGWAPWVSSKVSSGIGALRVGKLSSTRTPHLLGSFPVFHLSENSR